jgi:hypothetical protein
LSRIRTYPLVVNDLDDGGEFAALRVVASDDNDAANLNEAPVASLDQCFAHVAGGLRVERVSGLMLKGNASIETLRVKDGFRAHSRRLVYRSEVIV